MKYEMRRNEERKGYELKFDAKPSKEVLAELKANAFCWNPKAGVWFISDKYFTKEIKSNIAKLLGIKKTAKKATAKVEEKPTQKKARKTAKKVEEVKVEKVGGKFHHNKEKDGLEIIFNGKPSEEVRNGLKANGFRFNPKTTTWWIKGFNEENLAIAKSIVA